MTIAKYREAGEVKNRAVRKREVTDSPIEKLLYESITVQNDTKFQKHFLISDI
jgi:hypothetical protein